MYYEVYIDVLFLINFMMDYLLLLIVRRVLKCTATHGNICVGSIFGAAAVCICMLLPVRSTLIRFLLFHLSVNAAMIWIGLKIRTLREFLKAFVALYASAFLLGGVFTAAVCARGKSFFWRSSRKLLSGDRDLEISFVSAAHE